MYIFTAHVDLNMREDTVGGGAGGGGRGNNLHFDVHMQLVDATRNFRDPRGISHPVLWLVKPSSNHEAMDALTRKNGPLLGAQATKKTMLHMCLALW